MTDRSAHDAAPADASAGASDTAPGAETAGPGAAVSDRDPPAAKGGRRRLTGDAIQQGVDVIQAHLKTLPGQPGVYRMLDPQGEALYVGKARNLKRRVTNYTQIGRQPARLLRMIAETRSMEFVVTRSEVEALLLEANLIKRLRPRYNVLLRDDKTFPHILIASDHPFPQLAKHRGAESRPGRYFGPFASAGVVNRTIASLQRAFLLRNCTDSVFNTRTRPCLQYQIKRCTAPCVGYVGEADYAEQVAQAQDFLSGKSQDVQRRFSEAMMAAAERMEYEDAAKWRDRVRALAAIHAHQDINIEGLQDADAFACHQAGGATCIQVYFFRGGRNYGTRAYFPTHDKDQEVGEVLASFLGQFYDNKAIPDLLILSHPLEEADLLAEALTLHAGHKVQIQTPKRGEKRRLIDHALSNAKEALGRRLAESSTQRTLLAGLADRFGLEAAPEQVEVYDNSHIGGTDAIGAMIVAGPEGFVKNQYRKFNIKGIKAASQAPEVALGPEVTSVDGADTAEAGIVPGDDYAMMREVLTRRFSRALKEDPDRSGGAWPDLVLVDGGRGQLSIAREVFAELGIDDVPLVAIAKGPERNAGRERFFMADRPPFSLEPRDPVLYFLQRLRDEAHRFAIGTHRAKRGKKIGASPIDEIDGIGPRRKKALLMHFGSARSVARASLEDLEAVEGISKAVARKIYDHFHPNG